MSIYIIFESFTFKDAKTRLSMEYEHSFNKSGRKDHQSNPAALTQDP